MKNRIFTLSVMGALIIFGCGQEELMSPQLTHSQPGTVLSKSAGTPVVATIALTVVDPGNITVLPNGSLKIRNQLQQGPITGGLANTDDDAVTVLIKKAKISTAGNGPANGSVSITACHAVLGCGTFDGKFKGRNTGFLFADKFKATGTSGDFVGMSFTGTFTETTPTSSVFVLTGTIR